MSHERIEWIDVVKGIGILLVAGSHIFGGAVGKYSEWFYMPLFFFLSGYLYAPAAGWSFIGKRVRHLLLPYAAFMVLLGVIVYAFYLVFANPVDTSTRVLLEFVGRMFYGGLALGGVFGYLGRSFGVFWFVTCLFLTQVLYNAIQQASRGNRAVVFLVMAAMYVLAMLDSHFRMLTGAFNDWGLPWALNVAAMAMVFFYAGHMSAEAGRSKRYAERMNEYDALLLVASILFVILAVFLDNCNVLHPALSGMKFARYGIPVYSTLLSLACICLTIRLSQVIAAGSDLLKHALMECGMASMVIMYFHSFVQFTMKDNPATQNVFLRMAVAVLLSYCLYKLLMLSRLTRKLFLGSSR